MAYSKVLIGVPTGEYARRADFYDYYNLLVKPEGTAVIFCHDRSPAHGRNLIIQLALDNDCTHVLFIDDDMAYHPSALLDLLSHDKDIVTGLYLSRAYPHQPLIFDLNTPEGALFCYLEENEPRLRKVANAGLGFCLIKTDVFRKMEKPWVRLGELDCEQWCDDIGFFNRVEKAGFEIYCDTQCRIGHMGTVVIWPYYDEQTKQWHTSYDTGGKGRINTPQVNPNVIQESANGR